MVPRSDDTIAAIATPPGEGAISVVRVSGPDALKIADTIFRGRTTLAVAPGFSAHLGEIIHPSGGLLDQVIVTIFKTPHSYTGDDTAEISCHGGSYLTQRVLDALESAGARPAEPGEFTRRSFLNRKMDLTQAEAVADLIASRTERAQRVSLEQLRGRLGDEIRQLRGNLVDLCSLMELELDFAEEEIEITSNKEIREKLEIADGLLDSLVKSYQTGKLYRDGVSVAIAGPPNTGKSSIFNALLEHDRAIVTHVPGTTRDTLEESISIAGMLFRLTDMAGIRESSDLVESEGIQRARRIIADADIVLLVSDASSPDGAPTPLPNARNPAQRIVAVENKLDLLPSPPKVLVSKDPARVCVSAKTGFGMDGLRSLLVWLVAATDLPVDETHLVTRQRHRDALRRAQERLRLAIVGVEEKVSNEFVALDIRGAAESLGEITGEVTSEEILNNIFSSFCIGK